ncbi:CHRD domain-containing protein [Acetobacter farinalis]|uniref:CHRD domain-containing protein n=1 Tax=Acetobacter farinalis TaxID=1260984 RepID=A0ABT3Q9Z2_9PROT|nr:CHRD domain-containing protein [Acetobacter farinalis]MCX2562108.1 CHRD domain-containing protein [Acetobacter farinalis]NHO30720.1 CHRD domain-containing protein [Acetobacter farinalis]
MISPCNPIMGAVLALSLTGAIASPASAQRSILFSGALGGVEQHAPEHVSGHVVALYYPGAHVLRYTVTWGGLSGPVTQVQLHGPATPGQNAPPLITIKGPYSSPMSGGVMLNAAQAEELAAGKVYMNLQTTAHPDGEARGWLRQEK